MNFHTKHINLFKQNFIDFQSFTVLFVFLIVVNFSNATSVVFPMEEENYLTNRIPSNNSSYEVKNEMKMEESKPINSVVNLFGHEVNELYRGMVVVHYSDGTMFKKVQ